LLEIVDIAGLVKGASRGEGLGNQFLANIRQTDAIIHVLRCFEDDNIIHVDGTVDPLRDKEIIDTELQLKDLDSVEKKLQKVSRAAKTGDKDAVKAETVLLKYKAHLDDGKSARTLEMSANDKEHIADLCLLTDKPVMYVCNVDEASVVNGNKFVDQVKEIVKNEKAEVIIISAAIESDISELDSYEDRISFLNDLGLTESGVAKLITASYKLLNLITYFTAGVQEVRAWTINNGFKAPQAAGVIHTDFERGFIKADVISYEDFKKYGTESACREAGALRMEGKEYLVNDGDVMHFKFNV
jgi:GTP-binding protein YchF